MFCSPYFVLGVSHFCLAIMTRKAVLLGRLCSATVVSKRQDKTALHSFATKGTGPDSCTIVPESKAFTIHVHFLAWLYAALVPFMPQRTVDVSLVHSVEALTRNLQGRWDKLKAIGEDDLMHSCADPIHHQAF